MNNINTWRQGAFIDGPEYQNRSAEWKRNMSDDERRLVRPFPKGNAICECNDPAIATWIASRLNLASELEQMTYDFATGKTDGQEIRDFVIRSVND